MLTPLFDSCLSGFSPSQGLPAPPLRFANSCPCSRHGSAGRPFLGGGLPGGATFHRLGDHLKVSGDSRIPVSGQDLCRDRLLDNLRRLSELAGKPLKLGVIDWHAICAWADGGKLAHRHPEFAHRSGESLQVLHLLVLEDHG